MRIHRRTHELEIRAGVVRQRGPAHGEGGEGEVAGGRVVRDGRGGVMGGGGGEEGGGEGGGGEGGVEEGEEGEEEEGEEAVEEGRELHFSWVVWGDGWSMRRLGGRDRMRV